MVNEDMTNTTDLLDSLTDVQCRKFTQGFLRFYIENGFGSRLKTDIDCEVFNQLCNCDMIKEDTKPIVLGIMLKTTAQSINKYREYRFYQNKINEETQKESALGILTKNYAGMKDKNLIFSVHNVETKLYLEKILQEANQSYDYSFYSGNLKLSIEAFSYAYVNCGGSLPYLEKAVKKDKKIKQLWDGMTDVIKGNLQKMLEAFLIRAAEKNSEKLVDAFFSFMN